LEKANNPTHPKKKEKLSHLMDRANAPSIIFMDEIDSIGGSRVVGGKGDSEVLKTMLELLNQLDGFESTQNIKIIIATNRIDMQDDALLRPGRIDIIR
jgi:26S proteasome regulatory subunit T6